MVGSQVSGRAHETSVRRQGGCDAGEQERGDKTPLHAAIDMQGRGDVAGLAIYTSFSSLLSIVHGPGRLTR